MSNTNPDAFVRVNDDVLWSDFRGKYGWLYVQHRFPESSGTLRNTVGIFFVVPEHQQLFQNLLRCPDSESRRHYLDLWYNNGVACFLREGEFQTEKMLKPKHRRGKRHRMRTGGLLGEVV